MTLTPAFVDTTPIGPSAEVASVYRLRIVLTRTNRGRLHLVWHYRLMLSVGGAPAKRVAISRQRFEAALLAGATRLPDDTTRASRKVADYTADPPAPPGRRWRVVEHE